MTVTYKRRSHAPAAEPRAERTGTPAAVEGHNIRAESQQVIWRNTDSLKSNPRNTRSHPEDQLDKLTDSICRFGPTKPILIDRTGEIIAGHGVFEAAKRAGFTEVPTLTLNFTSAEKRAYAIADNRLAELSSWIDVMLGEELKFLSEEPDLDFDVSITGFDTVAIDRLIEGIGGAADPRDDEVPEPTSAGEATSREGDLWLLGRHRLLCGSALDAVSYRHVMGDRQARLVFTDPPYNVPIDGHVGGKGRFHHREFAMAAGEMTPAEFTDFLTKAIGYAEQACLDGAILFVCMDWRHITELLAAAERLRLEQKNLCVWAKDNAGLGTFYRSQHELVFVFKTGRGPHVNNFQLGQTGRYRTNVWEYPGVNSFGSGRLEDLAMHPTVKPVALVADAIKDCSHRGDVVLDPFAGSGTTLIAAEKTGRVGCAIELDPQYVDVIVRRWETLTGGEARHGETGRTFADMAVARRAPPVVDEGVTSEHVVEDHDER